jgi:hypothetical protein
MPNVTFLYQCDGYDVEKENTIRKICDYVSTLMELPDNIQIVFSNLGESIYGTTVLDPRFKNRINLNGIILNKEIPYVLAHELIHLNQIQTGRLSVTTNGRYIWSKQVFVVSPNLDIASYQQLPWELDVKAKHKQLLAKVLQMLKT